jgi:hypothetical protein
MKTLVRALFVVSILALGAGAALAQTPPVLDGTVEPSEYALSREEAGMRFGFTLSPDGATVFASISAKTAGWVALGFGSAKMDGSFMVLASVKDGKAQFTEDLGKGWTHAPTEPFTLGRAAGEADGWTTLEVAIPAARFLKAGTLPLIASWGRTEDFRAKHSGRTSLSVRF